MLLAAACASSDGIVTAVHDVGDGSPVAIEVSAARGLLTENSNMVDITVEVTNLSDHDITVTNIQLRPDQQPSAFTIGPVTKKVNELISDGKDFRFELQTWGRMNRALRAEESSLVIVEVRVALANGDIYRGTYQMPVQARGF